MWQELLLAGADPNAVDDEGECVLHRAVAKKYTDCALVLLEHGGSKSMGVRNLKNMTYVYLFCSLLLLSCICLIHNQKLNCVETN